MHGPRHVNESRGGLWVTRDAFFHTKNDTEFAGLALYPSKRQMRVQNGEFPVKHKQLVYSLMALLTCSLFTGQSKAQSNLDPDFRVRLWKNEEKGERMKFQNGVSFCLPKDVYNDLQKVRHLR